jgi:hypothetical protein
MRPSWRKSGQLLSIVDAPRRWSSFFAAGVRDRCDTGSRPLPYSRTSTRLRRRSRRCPLVSKLRISYFVRGGQSLATTAPVGVFILKVANGETAKGAPYPPQYLSGGRCEKATRCTWATLLPKTEYPTFPPLLVHIATPRILGVTLGYAIRPNWRRRS